MSKPNESGFSIFKDSKFNWKFPAGYNLLVGYCIKPKAEKLEPVYDDIKIVTDRL
jgi:hypothetical protein